MVAYLQIKSDFECPISLVAVPVTFFLNFFSEKDEVQSYAGSCTKAMLLGRSKLTPIRIVKVFSSGRSV